MKTISTSNVIAISVFLFILISIFSFKKSTVAPQFQNFVPAGTIIMHGGTSTLSFQNKWLLCNGYAYKVSDYPQLANALKDVWGKRYYRNGEQYFYVPDMRGVFVRGSNLDLNIPGGGDNGPTRVRYRNGASGGLYETVGTYQSDQVKGHDHGGGYHNHGGGSHSHSVDTWDRDNGSKNKVSGAFVGNYFKGSQRTSSSGAFIKNERIIRTDVTKKETTVRNVAVNYYIKATHN